MSADLAEHFDAVHSRQLQIEQNYRGKPPDILTGVSSGSEKKVDRFHSIARDDHLIPNAILFQCSNGKQFVVGVIFHE
jgi:hypothetical protein